MITGDKYMDDTKRSLICKKDIIFIAVLLCLAVIFYFVYKNIFMSQKSVHAEIYTDGKLVKSVTLGNDNTFTCDEIPQVTFDVKNGAIAFIHSDCPDKICIKSGYIKNAGQTAVCLPNKTTLKIVADTNNVDAVN